MKIGLLDVGMGLSKVSMLRYAVVTRVPDAERGESLAGNLEPTQIYIEDHKGVVARVEDYLPAGIVSALRLPVFYLGQIVLVDADMVDIETGRALAIYDISFEVFLAATGALQKAGEVLRKRTEQVRMRDSE